MKAYKFAFGWALIILFLCGINGSSLPKIDFNFTFGIDKLAHIFLFGMEAWLLFKASIKSAKKTVLQYALQAAAISSLYGVLIEILQGTIFVQRTFDFEDMLANAIGAALTIPLALLLVKKV